MTNIDTSAKRKNTAGVLTKKSIMSVLWLVLEGSQCYVCFVHTHGQVITTPVNHVSILRVFYPANFFNLVQV